MFKTEAEIIQVVTDKEGVLSDLRDQIESDFDLATMVPYAAAEGYESYTTSAPKNYLDKVMDGLNASEITIQIRQQEDASEKDRRAASLGERYLFGALGDIDRRFRNISEPPLREQLGWHLCTRGGLGIRALVYPQKDKTVFDVLLSDLLHTTWEEGPNGLLWGNNKRPLTKAQITAEYGIDITASSADLYDWWDEENNAIIIDGKFVKKPTKHHIGHVPMFIASVGSMPTILNKDGTANLKEKFQSIYSAARGLYEPFNKIASTTMDIYERSKAGSIKHTSKDGKKKLAPGVDPYLTFTEIALSEGETIEPLTLPDIPQAIAVIHALVDRDISQSTLPYPLAYGGTQQAMSGAALSVLVENTRSVFTPRTSAGEQVYTWLCEELLSQYSRNGAKAANLQGYDGKGDFFSTKVKPKDINPEWFVSVTWRPQLPRDKEAEIMMAKAATTPGPDGMPLLSKNTAYEDIMHLKDPDAEQDKIYEQTAEGLKPIMVSRIVEALVARGKPELAKDVLALLNPQAAQAPQLPPNMIMAAIEALSQSPETQPLAEAMAKAMGGQQGAPQGTQPGQPGQGGAIPPNQPPPQGTQPPPPGGVQV